MSQLRELDDRTLPGLARAYVSTRERVVAAFDSVRGAAPHGIGQRVLARLDGVDAAVSSKRRVGVVARSPYVAGIAGLAVVALCIVTLVVRPIRTAPQDQSDTSDIAPSIGSTYVGPNIGDSVPAYISKRTAELQRLAKAYPKGPTLAVLSFSTFTSIDDAAALLSGVTARRVFYGVHVPGTPTDVVPAPVVDFAADTRTAFAATARATARLSTSFEQFANAVPPTTAVQRRYKKLYEQYAHAKHVESVAFGSYCSCVIGAVVESTLGELAALDKRPGIRLIDVAPADVPQNSLGFRPISPDETGKITAGTDDSLIVPQP